ncbi:hypothetical protein PTT_06931 [Pyrenophora teres f. teres 0-1]|uniref:Methyltransferase type 12 domain-containing protein n=1 Tax=Pyrenophora teres f. teres (strain 0-1) TaxID=861557 RepID=E3RGJ6_PYRTT|nr:hypothetical protein PTT_06931 [Pyrenophora teres f. teres 0-1]
MSLNTLKWNKAGDGWVVSGSKKVLRISGSHSYVFVETEVNDKAVAITARSAWPLGHQECIPLLGELSRLVISHAARVATSIDVHKPHLASYKQWLIQQHTPNLGDTDTAALSQPIETLMKVLEVTPAARAALAITAISNSMEAVLEREKTGWEVMNDNGSLNSLTAFLQEHDDSEYIWSIAHTKLKMSVLEPLYSQLVVTDESLNNLNAIKEDFKGVPRVKFSVLDVSGSLAEQGFENQQFDLIIATHAISTGNDIQASLRTLHQLLRPNGRLILRVPRPGLLWAKFALGTQPDWWSHAEDMSRIEEPFLSTEKWNGTLSAAGFFQISHFPPNSEQCTNNVLVAHPLALKTPSKRVTLLMSNGNFSSEPSLVQSGLEGRGYTTEGGRKNLLLSQRRQWQHQDHQLRV